MDVNSNKWQPGGRYALCENMFAIPGSAWHIRELKDGKPKFGGGADTKTLCGRDVTWDINLSMTEERLGRPEHTCPKCLQLYRDDTPKQQNPPASRRRGFGNRTRVATRPPAGTTRRLTDGERAASKRAGLPLRNRTFITAAEDGRLSLSAQLRGKDEVVTNQRAVIGVLEIYWESL